MLNGNKVPLNNLVKYRQSQLGGAAAAPAPHPSPPPVKETKSLPNLSNLVNSITLFFRQKSTRTNTRV